MWSLASTALAAPIVERVSLVGEAGAYTDRSGVGFGLAAASASGPVTVGATALAVGRLPAFDVVPISERAGIGLATVELGVGAPDAPVRFLGLLDAAALDPVERECTRRDGCRSQFFLRFGPDAPVGVSLQPAAGVRLGGGAGSSGVRASTSVAVQPTWRYEELLFVPRLDLTVWSDARPWSVHAWAGRYGAAVGLGHALSRPRPR